MSADPAAKRKASRPGVGIRGILVGCILMTAIGIIALIPWAYNSPTTRIYEFKKHYSWEIPAQILRALPPGYPSEIAFRPPRYLVLPPALKAILLSLAITLVACGLIIAISFLRNLYAARWNLPWPAQLALGILGYMLLAWFLVSTCRRLIMLISRFNPPPG
jgi:hypothetical protein